MPARGQEIALGIGFHKQTAVQSALAAADLWSLPSSEFVPVSPELVNETDALDYGKGHEFAENVFPSHAQGAMEWPYFLTSEGFAQAIVFGLGDVTKVEEEAAAAWSYTCTPLDPVTDGVDLPTTTIVGGIRQGAGGEIHDVALVGAVCSGFNLRVSQGPGRQNSQLRTSWLSCGKWVDNSGIAIPSLYSTNRLGAGTADVITINGVDYFSNARFVDYEFDWQNVPLARIYPGSGSQSGYDLAGQMRFGIRTARLTIRAELESASDELSNMLAGTEGTAIIQLTGGLIAGSTNHQARIDCKRIRFVEYSQEEVDNFVVCRVVAEVMMHTSNGLVEMKAICGKDEIGTSA
jgi:hypothetical protein